jgi:hypothetical protein
MMVPNLFTIDIVSPPFDCYAAREVNPVDLGKKNQKAMDYLALEAPEWDLLICWQCTLHFLFHYFDLHNPRFTLKPFGLS